MSPLTVPQSVKQMTHTSNYNAVFAYTRIISKVSGLNILDNNIFHNQRRMIAQPCVNGGVGHFPPEHVPPDVSPLPILLHENRSSAR